MNMTLEKELKAILAERGAEDQLSSAGALHKADISEEEYLELCLHNKMEPEGKKGVPADLVLHKDRILTFKGSDETPDRYGDIVRVDGWDLKNYNTNPVFLSQHESRKMPVGRTLRVWKAKDIEGSPNKKALMFRVYFPPAEVSPEADAMFRLYKARILNAVSVGFQPKKVNSPKDDDERKALGLGPFGYEFLEQELWELSGVTIPANPNALVVMSADKSLQRSAALLGISSEAENGGTSSHTPETTSDQPEEKSMVERMASMEKALQGLEQTAKDIQEKLTLALNKSTEDTQAAQEQKKQEEKTSSVYDLLLKKLETTRKD